ncbi:hypothetical protein B0H19DRAFT_1150850 [Mycena capillaripes]|nr:hypothetical protein B0H19DRAFT_1150850 [Mycena capillaripes]
MLPPLVPATPSPKKRGASEMDSGPVEGPRPSGSGSRKRVRVADENAEEKEKPQRSLRRRS